MKNSARMLLRGRETVYRAVKSGIFSFRIDSFSEKSEQS